MAIRFYLLPIEQVVSGTSTLRGPKYLPWRFDPDPPALVSPASQRNMDYGMEPVMLAACDIADTEHATLAAQADVTSIPANLDSVIATVNARNTVRSRLEAFNIPANWVIVGVSYRQVLRCVMAIFGIAQRFNGLGMTRLVVPGVTMSTPYSDMPVAYRNALVQAIDELGYDRSGLTASSTLRDLLESIANQAAPAEMLGVSV